VPLSSCTPACLGNVLQSCSPFLPNAAIQYDCASLGYTCGADPDIDCLTSTRHEPCSVPGVVCLQGDVGVCDGTQYSLFHCGSLGGTCVSGRDGGVPYCATPSAACTPFDEGFNTCTGDRISLCITGQSTSFDCQTIGLHCVPGQAGDARCE
jgi:hypothetical protein